MFLLNKPFVIIFPPAGFHLLQAKKMNGQKACYPLAAVRRVRAHIELE